MSADRVKPLNVIFRVTHLLLIESIYLRSSFTYTLQ